MATSFKKEILIAEHDFTNAAHTFRIALYDNNASFTASVTVFTVTNEISGTGYSTPGGALTNVTPTTTGTTAFCDFSDLVFSTATITARGALLYNDTHASNAVVLVLDFGSDKSSTAGDFTIQFPTADASNAIIRIA